MASAFPYFSQGKVVKGFGRGSKELGIPTANFPDSVVDRLPSDFECGIYFGWAMVDSGPVHKMVMSVGWNPYYKNTKKTMETHIMHTFKDDFYGSPLKVCLAGYLRPEKSFNSLDDLIGAIKEDIRIAGEQLDQRQYSVLQSHSFFKSNNHVL